MANNFKAYENFQRNFNNKYKVNFSFEQYEEQKLNKKKYRARFKGSEECWKRKS